MQGPQLAVLLLIALIGAAVLIIMYSLALRYRRRELQHRERLTALEKGAPLPVLTDVEKRAPWTPQLYLLRGMMWLFSGIAITLLFAGIAATSQRTKSVEERVMDATRLKSMGATDEQARQVQNDTAARGGMSPAVALIGLVPIGVGLAYLIFYRLEGKNMAALVRPE